jgi:signal transduction histidine kinase
VLVLALFFYVYYSTAIEVAREADQAVKREYELLATSYESGGLRELNQQVIERSATDGPLQYMLADQSGSIIAGDFERLPDYALVGDAPQMFDFPYAVRSGERMQNEEARAYMGRLLNGPILMISRDHRETRAAAARMTRALSWAVGIAIAFSIVAGLIAAWFASRRIEHFTETMQQVMAGDLTQRVGVIGWNDEHDILAKNLNEMLDRLEKLVHAQREAGDAIAHDLRTPLARLRQNLEEALGEPPDETADRDALRKAQEETDRVLKTFNSVLQLARLNSAETWRFGRVELHTIVAEMVEFYEPAAEAASVTLSSQCSPYLVVMGDARLVAQALANLLDNAMKYTPEGGRVMVSTAARSDGRVEIRVADSGPGVPPEKREQVKERFVRLEKHRSSPGVGLGLSLVAAVAELHGGELMLEDGLTQGAARGLSAVLVLPAAPPPRRGPGL